MKKNKKEPKVIGSIVKAVDVLKCFEGREELGVSELSAILGMHKSTAYSIITTLQHLNLLEQSHDSRKYRLGIELFRLGSFVSLHIRHAARYELECLQEDVKETVHLARRNDLSILFLERFESVHSIKIYTVDAMPLPVYATAVGKAMLSTLDDSELTKLVERIEFERLTQNTICDPVKLLEEVKRARRNGFAVDNEELEEGLSCIAAPLYDFRGRSEYAISVSGPTARTGGNKYNDIIRKIRKTSADISKKLGFQNDNRY